MSRIISDTEKTSTLPVLGKIKCGDKTVSSSGKEIPRSLDYFVCTGKYKSVFDRVFDKPTVLHITFLSNNINNVCNERWECRDRSGKRTGWGDGKTFHLWQGEAYEERVMGQTIERGDLGKYGDWKAVLTLRFAILELNTIFGHWQLDTSGSASSIPALRDTFDAVMEQAGTVVGVPFDLIVEKVTSQKPGSKSKFPVMSLVANLGLEHLQLIAKYSETGNRLTGILTQERMNELQHQPLQLQQSNGELE